jgi:hypothetical protein
MKYVNEQNIKYLQVILGIIFTLFIFLPFLGLFIVSSGDLDLQTILSITMALIILILHILFLIQTLLHERKEYYLTYGLLIGILASLTAGIGQINFISDFVIKSDMTLIISLLLWSITYLLIYLFFESLYGIEINNSRLFIVSFFFFMSFISHLAIIAAPNDSSIFWYWADFGYNGLGISIFVFGIWVLIKSYNQVGKENNLVIQITGLGFILFGFIISFMLDFSTIITEFIGITPEDFIETYFGDLFKVLGIIIFTLSYIKEIDYIYRLPFPINTIIFFKSDSGLSLNITAVKNIKHTREIKIDENLITGTLSAIMTLLKEGLGSRGYIESIASTDQTILVNSNKDVSIAVITNKPTKVLQNSIKMALQEFTIKYEEILKLDTAIEVSEFSETREILKKAFPYIEI